MRTSRGARRFAAVATAAGVLVGMSGMAQADDVYNTLDNTIDTTHEVMNLVVGGSNGTTTLKIQVEGKPDHPGCNIQGASHYIGLAVSSSDPNVATVEFVNGDGTFNDCDETLTVVVIPGVAGSTTVSFTIDASKSSSDPHLGFSLAEATFVVNVAENGGGGGGSVCDADPAAPAWAASILQAGGSSPGARRGPTTSRRSRTPWASARRSAGTPRTPIPNTRTWCSPS